MAKYYRNYLFGSRERYEVKTPIYLTSLGVVNRQEKMIGIPVNKERALTEYEEAQKMLEALTAYGIDKISFRYLNWIKDEYDSTVIQKLKPNSILGGKTSFEKLCGYIKENGLQFYPNLQLVFVGRDNYFNKYSGLNHSALPLDKICTLKNGYLLNSESILNLSQTFPSQLNELPVSTISIDTIGSNLYSDYSDNNTVLREEAIDNYTEVLKNLSKDYSLMTSVGNSYTLQYVTDVLELPLTSSKYYIESDSVPFVEMVLHGYINYAGQPINLQTDTTDAFLKSIETGAGLSFLLNVSEVELIKNTKYTNLFSSSFEEWDEIIQGYYLSSSELYEQTKGAVITNHEKVSDNVFKTIYDNGIETYVNYDESTYGQDGIVVEGKSFSIVTKQEGN